VKEKFWAKDWFAALAFALVFIILAFGIFADAFESLERYSYDLGVRARQRQPSERIAVIAIDDQSIANLGRWPWPRNLHAQMIDKLSQGGAKVIGNTVFYSEAQQDPGLKYVTEISQQLAASPLMQAIPGEIQTFVPSWMMPAANRTRSRVSPTPTSSRRCSGNTSRRSKRWRRDSRKRARSCPRTTCWANPWRNPAAWFCRCCSNSRPPRAAPTSRCPISCGATP